jgi:hypothetical protein
MRIFLLEGVFSLTLTFIYFFIIHNAFFAEISIDNWISRGYDIKLKDFIMFILLAAFAVYSLILMVISFRKYFRLKILKTIIIIYFGRTLFRMIMGFITFFITDY